MVSDVEICSGNSATILASGGNIYRWYDSPIGGTVLFEGNPFVTLILSETKRYYVSNVNGLESTREELLVTVFPNPEIICPDPVSYFTNSINFNFNVINGSSPFEFVIDFGDNTTLTTLTQTVSHTYMEDGVFDLGIIVKDVNGCVSSCETEVIVYKGIFIPNVITANKDTKNEIFNLYYILNNQYVTYNGEEDFLLEIYNRWGNKIYFTTDPVSGWNGEEVDTGTFYYNIKIGSQNFRGWIQVLR
ncbi:MAG: gliding motility-associated C-terminal domain-containing protein [Cyclobacteriaceae bacterium]|nr:gliding motility-associated C-terminal domain-containing protein [Cyclobacteriaceae bacterium]